MDTIKQAMKVIKEGIKLLPDDAKGDFKTQLGDIFIDEAISNACGMVNTDAEKTALLGAYAVQEANRVVSDLWREELLTEDLEKEYRALPKMKEMADKYNDWTTKRKARLDAIMDSHKAIMNEEKDLDIFKAVINGMSKEEAEKKHKEYETQQAQAMGR